MEPRNTNIQVAIRIRPLIVSENEKKLRAQWGTQNNIIYQIDETGQKFGELYSFDHIFGVEKNNLEIYNDIVKDFVASSLDGLNSTIFAYGQTSSGKTYTMLGNKKDTGIMSLAIENIINSIENNKSRKFLLRVSYIEIYNEKVNDLLDPANKDIRIREFTSTIGLQNVKEEIVSTREQIFHYLKVGNLNRHIGSTKANERSSRSHTIFKIMIESTQICDFDSGCVQISNLNLVDLAGSERVAQTKATGVRLKEGGHINKSLSALGLVIRQLSDGQEYVNFRDSKLTRLLQDSLGGNSKTLIIATITSVSIEDTASTLAFAQRAKAVKNKPHVNEILTEADKSKRYAALNAQLQEKLQQYEDANIEHVKEMARLQQQMEMLEEFQFGKNTPDLKSVPKRRHTIIGFSAQKKLFSKLPIPEQFDKRTSDPGDIPVFEDLVARDTSTTTLGTIFEEETFPLSKFATTPEKLLRTRLSALEQDYNELVTYTRDEDNVRRDIRKVEEIEEQLKIAQNKLLAYQDQQKVEKELEDNFVNKEQRNLNNILKLEQELGQKNVDNVFENDLSDIGYIQDKLIILQGILHNSTFVNNLEKAKEEDSVLRIIEKFNSKVKTSKDIIETEILKQINNFDHGSQNQIELPTFNDLLNEIALFESDIPVDLINNMKREGIEDLKILMKICGFIGRCSDKIKSLEEEKNEINKIKASETELTQEIQRLKEEYSSSCFERELQTQQIEKLRLRNESFNKELHSLQVLIEENEELKSRNHGNQKLRQENNLLKTEIENVKFASGSYSKELDDFRNNINKLNIEIEGKDNSLLELAEKYERLRTEYTGEKETLTQELNNLKENNKEKKQIQMELETKCNTYKEEQEKLKQEVLNNCVERERLLEEINKMKSISESANKEIDKLNLELNENKRINVEQNNCVELKQQIKLLERLRTEHTGEKETLTQELYNLKEKNKEKKQILMELETKCSMYEEEQEKLKKEVLNDSVERERLLEEINKMKSISESANNEIDKLTLESNENKRISEELKQQIKLLENEIENIKISNVFYCNNITKLNGDITERDNALIELKNEKEEIQNNCAKLKEEKENVNETLSKICTERKLLEKQIEEFQSGNKELNGLKHLLDKLTLEKNYSEGLLETKCTEFLELQKKYLDSCHEKEVLLGEIEKLNEELYSNNEMISDCENKCAILKEEKDRINQEFSNVSSEKEFLDKQVQQLENDKKFYNDALQEACSKLEQEIQKLKKEINEKNNKIEENEKTSVILKKEIENNNFRGEERIHLTGSIDALQRKCTRLEEEKEALFQTVKTLEREIDEKTKTILSYENTDEKYGKAELDTLKDKLNKIISENESLKMEIERLKSNLLGSDKIETIQTLKQKSASLSVTNEHLKAEVQRLKITIDTFHQTNKINEHKMSLNEMQIQRWKQALEKSYVEINDLKAALAEKEVDAMKNCQQQEEYRKINKQLSKELKALESISKSVEKDKDELQCVLCSIIEYYINEQKSLLLIRHSQDQREHFKSILKDLKSNISSLKNQGTLIQNKQKCDLGEISNGLIKCAVISKEYLSLEKSFLQSHIGQLDSTNKAYLEEIMAIKDDSSVSDCPNCDFMKKELKRLNQLSKSQEEKLGLLNNKNTQLGKENVDRMKQIVDLQGQIYDEQDKKGVVQNTSWLKLYRDNDKQQQILQVQEQLQNYKRTTTPMANKEIQCNLLPTESVLQEKYALMKTVCARRKEKNKALELEIDKLKGLGSNAQKEVQCEIINAEKYYLMKNICISRKEENMSLKAQLAALRGDANSS